MITKQFSQREQQNTCFVTLHDWSFVLERRIYCGQSGISFTQSLKSHSSRQTGPALTQTLTATPIQGWNIINNKLFLILFLLSVAGSIDWVAIAKCRGRVEQIVSKLQFKAQLFFFWTARL